MCQVNVVLAITQSLLIVVRTEQQPREPLYSLQGGQRLSLLQELDISTLCYQLGRQPDAQHAALQSTPPALLQEPDMFDAISRDDSFTYNMPPYGPAGMAGPIGPWGPRDQTNPLFGADLMRSREGAAPAAWPQSGVCGRVPDTGRLCGLPAA